MLQVTKICWLSPPSLVMLGIWGEVSEAVNLKVIMCSTFLIVLMLPSVVYIETDAHLFAHAL